MFLPSRLRDTSLDALLAALHRARATGVLELVAPGGRRAVHLRRGLVHAVEAPGEALRFGDVAARRWALPRAVLDRARALAEDRGLRIGHALVAAGALTPAQRDGVIDAQRRARLAAIGALGDADVRFRVARPLPPGAAEARPLDPAPSLRDAAGDVAPSPRRRALAALGLDEGASPTTIRAAYRRRVLALHPDRAAGADEPERARRTRELQAVLAAWAELSPGLT